MKRQIISGHSDIKTRQPEKEVKYIQWIVYCICVCVLVIEAFRVLWGWKWPLRKMTALFLWWGEISCITFYIGFTKVVVLCVAKWWQNEEPEALAPELLQAGDSEGFLLLWWCHFLYTTSVNLQSFIMLLVMKLVLNDKLYTCRICKTLECIWPDCYF